MVIMMRKVVIMIAAIMVIDGINFDRRANLHDSFIIPHQLFDDPLLFDQLNKSQFCNWTTIFLWQCNFTLMINILCACLSSLASHTPMRTNIWQYLVSRMTTTNKFTCTNQISASVAYFQANILWKYLIKGSPNTRVWRI